MALNLYAEPVSGIFDVEGDGPSINFKKQMFPITLSEPLADTPKKGLKMNQVTNHTWYTVKIPSTDLVYGTSEALVRHFSTKEKAFEVVRQVFEETLVSLRLRDDITNISTATHEDGDRFKGNISAFLDTKPVSLDYQVFPNVIKLEFAEKDFLTPWELVSKTACLELSCHILVQ